MTLTEKPGHGSSDSSIQLPYQSPAQSEQLIWFKQPVGKPQYGPTAPKQTPHVFQSSTNFSTWETDSSFRRGVGFDSEVHLEFCIKDFSFSDVLMQLFEPGNQDQDSWVQEGCREFESG